MTMNNPTQNLEEAATVASEFIYSIDNLPNEVQFLLSEIRAKDTRAQELQQEIDRESARYVRHALRSAASSTPSSSSALAGSSSPSSSATPTTNNHSSSPSNAAPTSPTTTSRAGSPRSSGAPSKIAASYGEIQQLCEEKCALAQRLIDLINRTRAKLDHDLTRVRVLQGEPTDFLVPGGMGLGLTGLGPTQTLVGAAGVAKLNGAGGMLLSSTGGLGGADGLGRNPALQISESLRNVLRSSPSAAAIDSVSSGGTGSATKRRRLGTSASIKLTTPARRRSASPATTASTTTHTHQRSRLSRQVLPPEESEEEAEGEGEGEENAGENTEEMEDVDADDDDKIYCFCRKKSFGDMIACDNEGNCPYEWFHLSCVGLKQPPPETWYCSECSASMTKGSSGTRKGRKK